MAYECKTLSEEKEGVAQVCIEWHEASFLPYLSAADRDAILVWIVSIFAVVYAVKRIRRMLGA